MASYMIMSCRTREFRLSESLLFTCLRSRRRGEGNWGERERTPAIRTPLFISADVCGLKDPIC